MNYLTFRQTFKHYTVFSLDEIRKLEPRFHRRRLTEWQEHGYITKLSRGHYIFSDLPLREEVLFEIANRIYSPSYVSFEAALAYHKLIPEGVYAVTSAATQKTYCLRAPVAEFIYRTVKEKLFFGYDLVTYDKKSFKMASLEKALLDYFYFRPGLRSEDDFASLRINREMFFGQINEKRLRAFLVRFSQKALTKRIHSFLRFLRHA